MLFVARVRVSPWRPIWWNWMLHCVSGGSSMFAKNQTRWPDNVWGDLSLPLRPATYHTAVVEARPSAWRRGSLLFGTSRSQIDQVGSSNLYELSSIHRRTLVSRHGIRMHPAGALHTGTVQGTSPCMCEIQSHQTLFHHLCLSLTLFSPF